MKSAYLWYGRFIGVANLIYGAWLIIATVINTTNGSYGAGWLALFYLRPDRYGRLRILPAQP